METALITGATRGIGREVARRLAAEGFHVVLGARDLNRGREVAASMKGAVDVIGLDMVSVASINSCVHDIAGPIDLLVNNAGVYRADEETIWAVNVRGPIHLTRELDPKLTPRARIVNVTSGMGALAAQPISLRQQLENESLTIGDLLSLPPGGYGESKAVLNAFSRILAREWPQRLVCAVSPGWVRTDMGGPDAPRDLNEGVNSVLAACHLPLGSPNGHVFQDGRDIGF